MFEVGGNPDSNSDSDKREWKRGREREREIGEYEWPPRSQIAHSANIAGEEKEKEKEKEKEGEAAAAADAVVAAAVAGNGATPAATMMQGSGIRQIVFAFALKERTKEPK